MHLQLRVTPHTKRAAPSATAALLLPLLAALCCVAGSLHALAVQTQQPTHSSQDLHAQYNASQFMPVAWFAPVLR